MRRATTSRGFTLIEMAVVLIIIGIIAALTIPLVGEKLKQDKLARSRGSLNSLKQEIIGYAQANKFLPAEGPSTTPGTVEASFANARDAQQNYIAYYVDPNLKSGDICTQTSTNYALTVGGATYSNLAFILASRGANQNLQINSAAGGTPPASRTVLSYAQGTVTDTVNAAPPNTSQTYDLAAADATAQFDDLVDYVTLDALKGKICSPTPLEPTGAAVGFTNIARDFPKDAGGFRSSNTNTVQLSASSISFGNGQANSYACIWSNATVPDADGNGIWDGELGETTAHGVNADGDHEHFVCKSNGAVAPNIPVVFCNGVTATGGFAQWKRMAAVFKFSNLYADKNPNSGDYSIGIIFSLITANGNGNALAAQNNTAADNTGNAAPCGDDSAASGNRGAYLGWSDSSGGGSCIRTPKIGVEIDMSYESTRNDPDVSALAPPCSQLTSTMANHVAVVYYTDSAAGSTSSTSNDNQHGNAAGTSGIINPPYAPENTAGDAHCSQESASQDGFATNATAWYDGTPDREEQWLEDQDDHWIRIQIERNTTTHVYDVYVWLDDSPNATFLNVDLENGAQMVTTGLSGADYFEHRSVTLSATDDAKFDYFRFGWTMGVSSTGTGQTINLSSFGMNASRNN